MRDTKIQWTDSTWNCIVGCTRVSPGCDNCYALALHDRRHIAWKRGRWPDAPAQYHQPFSRVQLREDRLTKPRHWHTPRRVFVNSLSDLFHEDVPDEYIVSVWNVMAEVSRHTFQILTKRPERMARWCATYAPLKFGRLGAGASALRMPLPNVWLGVSVENQTTADERIPWLVRTPAAVRFLSVEPMLGPVSPWNVASAGDLRWIIIGGESGPHARPLDLAWVRWLQVECWDKGAAVFVNQLGSVWANDYGAEDSHGGDPLEWPGDLRVREFPDANRSTYSGEVRS